MYFVYFNQKEKLKTLFYCLKFQRRISDQISGNYFSCSYTLQLVCMIKKLHKEHVY